MKKKFNTQEFIDLSKRYKLKVLKRCIKKTNRLLKKKKEIDKKYHEIKTDLNILTEGKDKLIENQTLDFKWFNFLTVTINKYYYRKVPVILLLFLLLIVLYFFFRICWNHQSLLPTGGENITESEDTVDEEYVEIPGYQDMEISKMQPYIQLRNVEGNSVYLQYNIIQKKKTVYQSILIKPGNKCDKWNAYETLGEGKHNVIFYIRTFDAESRSECNSTTQPVTITIRR